MRTVLKHIMGGVCGVVIALSLVSAAAADGAGTGCVKAKFVGTATTYNPYKGGWKTGGAGLATGGTYNPNGWEAALQTDLARQYSCGYGKSKCQAVVEGNGKAMIVLINDNGPMCADPATASKAKDCKTRTSRVIDLNEKSMQYMGGGGSNSGTVPNVTVTLLCDLNNMLGPLNDQERAAWMNRTVGITPSNLDSGNLLTQATNGNQNVWQTLGQPLLGNSSPSSASVPSSYSTTPSNGYTSYPTTYASGYGTTQTTGTSIGTTPVSTTLSGSTGQTSTLSGTNTAQSLMNLTNGGSSNGTVTNTNTNTNTNDGNLVSSDLMNTSNQLAGGALGTPSTTLGTSVAIGTSRPTTFGDSYGSVDTSNPGSDLSSADQSGQSGDGTDASGSGSTTDASSQNSLAGVASNTMTTVRAILARIVTILQSILATLAARLMGGN